MELHPQLIFCGGEIKPTKQNIKCMHLLIISEGCLLYTYITIY